MLRLNAITTTIVITILTFAFANSLLAQDAGKLNTMRKLKEEVSHDGKVYLSIQKSKLTSSDKAYLKTKNAFIKAVYPDGSAIISFPKSESKSIIKKYKEDLYAMESYRKISEEIPYSEETGVAITFFEPISERALENIKKKFSISDNEFTAPGTQILIGNLDASRIDELAALPEVAYISNLVEEPEPLFDNSTAFHHAWNMKSTEGMDLTGKGVVVGLGDGGELGNHIDLEGKIINEASGTYGSYFDHADMMAGIIAGAGHIKSRQEGFAPNATLVTEKTFRIFYYLDDYYANHGMRLTNNSYGSSFSCSSAGEYDYYSIMMDQQQVDYDDVLHIVAGGNQGENTCNAYPTGYNTILKTYSASKNSLTVGAVNRDNTRKSTSGVGPVADGRIKPEVMGYSYNVGSTSNNNNYNIVSGTSAATAVVTGIATLITEKFRALNANEYPKGALLKAIICNTSDDAGNVGPDFQFGFGIVNGQRAVDNIEAGNYFLGTTDTEGESLTHTITVPANKKELKILLNWNDIPQPVAGVATLMNDLDLKVIAPDGTEFQPWVLDHSTSGVANVAVRGADHINNIEQVTIDNPMAGDYTIVVTNYNLESADQAYAISYHSSDEAFKVTYPVSTTTVNLLEDILVSWTCNLDGVTGFDIEYSKNDGATWTTVGSVGADERVYNWTGDGSNTEKGKIRVTAVGNGTQATSSNFNILRTPPGFSVTSLCGTYVQLDWINMAAAEGYEIYMFDGKDMKSMGTTTENTFLIEERLEVGETYWFAVDAKYFGGKSSRRTTALSTTTLGSYPCPWTDDVEVISFDAGAERGREYTSMSLSDNEQLQISLFNAGTNTLEDVQVSININGTIVTETVNSPINPGNTIVYTTTNSFDFSDAGNYNIIVDAIKANDEHTIFNSLDAKCTQLANDPIDIPVEDYLEDVADIEESASVFGVDEYPAIDFETNGTGRLVTVDVGGEIGRILEGSNYSYTGQSDWTITKNLDGHEDIFLRFYHRLIVPGPDSDAVLAGNTSSVRFYIRGNDTDAWIPLMDLNDSGNWPTEGTVVNVYEELFANGQLPSSSTQFRFALTGESRLQLGEFSFLRESNILPVELTSFTAVRVEEDVMLEWVTASEENNSHFEVEVAIGDEMFSTGNFINLGRVYGQGTTVVESQYQFFDTEKFKTGVRYYRLKQVDYDGTYAYTETIPVFFDVMPQLDIRVFPNPVSEGINPNVYFELEKSADVRFILSNARGEVLMRVEKFFEAGSNTFTILMNENWDPGVYYLTASLGKNNDVAAKIVKVADY